MDLSPPATFDDWLVAELDKKLSSLPSNRERSSHCRLLLRAWSDKFSAFIDDGTQPFNQRHPQFGDMDAFNFRLLICAIEERSERFQRVLVLS